MKDHTSVELFNRMKSGCFNLVFLKLRTSHLSIMYYREKPLLFMFNAGKTLYMH